MGSSICAPIAGTSAWPADIFRGVNSLRDRLGWVIANRRQPDGEPWTEKSLSRASGLSPNTIGTFRRGNGEAMRKGNVDKIAQTAGVSAAWLAYGAGTPDDPQDDSATPAVEHGDSADPRMSNRTGFAACLASAKLLRPQHPSWVWSAVAESDPLLTVPLTPILLADIADLLMRHMPGPAAH